MICPKPKSAIHCLTKLFPIYQNKSSNIRRWDGCSVDPSYYIEDCRISLLHSQNSQKYTLPSFFAQFVTYSLVPLATLYLTSVVILADSMGLIIFFHHNVSGESAELCFFCLPNITAMHCRQKYWEFSCLLIILFSSVYGKETESLIWCHYISCKISKINLILFPCFLERIPELGFAIKVE